MAPRQEPVAGRITRRKALGTIAGAGTVAIAGCAGADGGEGLSGTIDASGSNTVAPITSWAGENFSNEFPDVLVDVDPQGTGAGFQEFCRQNSDVQSASRLITDGEIELCGNNDIDYDHIEVGLDGLAVVKNSENDWVEEITLEELRRVWEFESDVETWSDIRDEWPDREIALHARDSASGTFDYFTREINGEMGDIRDDYSATSQTNEIMGAVANNVDGFGWGGVGYLRAIEEDEPIEAVPVESDTQDGFYLPQEENIESGAYSPLARPLFVYFNLASLEERTDLLGSFARFYVNGQHEFARDEGFFATTDEAQSSNHDKIDGWLEVVGAATEDLSVQRE
ncbi:ABC-type phosphate transport system, periplasmiccomponent [Halalkaliarchaeum sp. AArc-CO]|uniref:PstS family phosphate ABC transporter substrate-binding protein n=1 Tax=unclassified Halalkaliarchaeum TaxID=2678344 RepID=UPI00217F1116|nr:MULTISPECIES: PstS family phosphate ABC transporter substrate-binding protein [unclassified Halalkaliarchaeum]MDR5672213.1 PstS family phosphate ABC transporter substrate-binding protein [Halalkaliarchaeum sp. AArc-GB]UWG51719.1 ABC-type phosphate transport system, periplasmiccomponent [Halalkaliarchaeum sp. AArc-CO]